MLLALFMKSAGAGVGMFIGCLIGLSVRKRSGKSEGLLAGSVLLTSVAAGIAGLLVMMVLNLVTGRVG